MERKKVEEIKEQLRDRVDIQGIMSPKRFVSTGSTLLNLACSGHPDKGFGAGHMYWFVGDSDSGKSFLCLTCFAEASINPEFDDYRLIYDAPEGGALMDIRKFFGDRVAERLEVFESETIQDFYFNLDDCIKEGKKFIYVLDSHDCLSSLEEIAHFSKMKEAVRRKGASRVLKDDDGRKLKGTFGGEKAKWNSQNLRKLMAPLRKMESILIVISQTRDSYDPFVPSTASGGRALKFYATYQLWSSQAGKIKRIVNGRERELGTFCKVRVRKNRVVGRDRSVVIPVYHSFGVDDVGGMVDYLVAEKVWKQERETDNAKIIVSGLGPERAMRKEALIEWIESEDLCGDLKALVAQTWDSIEEACKVNRRFRYNI